MIGLIGRIGLLSLLLLQADSLKSPAVPVLTRDVDKRPLLQVSLAELPSAMRKAVLTIVKEKPRPRSFILKRIPVAPQGHRLYVLLQSGPEVCSVNGPNCPITVFDETSEQVKTIADFSGVGIEVVRRPMLQMPDIATQEQLGHFATYTTVYRYDGQTWRPYLCKDAPIADGEDPHPEWVGYQSCQQ